MLARIIDDALLGSPDIQASEAAQATLAKTPRGHKRPPARLDAILGRVKLVRFTMLPDLDERLAQLFDPEKLLFGRAPSARYLINTKPRHEKLLEALKSCLKDTPPQIRRYILKHASPGRAYLDLQHHRDRLLQIARDNYPVFMGSLLNRNERGQAKWERDELGDVLDDENVNLDYIRECLVCKHVHYAARIIYKGRTIEPHCSPRCGHTLRNRRYAKPVTKVPSNDDIVNVRRALKTWEGGHSSIQMTARDLAASAGISTKRCQKVLNYLRAQEENGSVKTKRADSAAKR